MKENMQSVKINDKEIYYIDSDDPVISYLKNGQLFGYGNWEILNNLILYRGNESYLIDCGAHIGTFSFVPGLFHSEKMILIDGAKDNVECLNKTFNNVSNVEIHNKILLDSIKKCNFSSDYGPFGSAFNSDDGTEESTTLDNIVGERKVSAIKFDIEGNEPEALMGSIKTLELNKPPMLIEVNGHCLRLHEKLPKNLFDVLDSLNYSYFIKNNNNLIAINKNDIFPFCVIDIICLHKDYEKIYMNRFNFHPPIPKSTLIEIAKQNYTASNQDCKNYFDTLNLDI
jgi:FkbM family methyltransferase